MSELQRARAFQRLKQINQEAKKQLPQLESGAPEEALTVGLRVTKNEIETATENMFNNLSAIIKDFNVVTDIMNDNSIINDDTVVLINENWNKILADLKKTFKGNLNVENFKGYLKRTGQKLVKQLQEPTPLGPVAPPPDYLRINNELDTLKQLLLEGRLIPLDIVDTMNRGLLERFAQSEQNVINKESEIRRIQDLITSGQLIPSDEVSRREEAIINTFLDRKPEDIVKTEELIEQEIETSAQGKPLVRYYSSTVKPKLSKKEAKRNKQLTDIITKLKDLVLNESNAQKKNEMEAIIETLKEREKEDMNILLSNLKDENYQFTDLSSVIDVTAPVVAEFRNQKVKELIKNPEYQDNQDKLKKEIAQLSKATFGYGLKKKTKK